MIKPSTKIEYLNHLFVLCKSKKLARDYICNKCGIRIHITTEDKIFKINNYIDDINCGNVDVPNKYELICEEQIIKNLLE